MKYCDGTNRNLKSVLEKGELRAMLADKSWSFTAEELDAIIHNEFFNDANPLDIELVDLVITRALLLKGCSRMMTFCRRNGKKMISEVLRELLKFNK